MAWIDHLRLGRNRLGAGESGGAIGGGPKIDGCQAVADEVPGARGVVARQTEQELDRLRARIGELERGLATAAGEAAAVGRAEPAGDAIEPVEALDGQAVIASLDPAAGRPLPPADGGAAGGPGVANARGSAAPGDHESEQRLRLALRAARMRTWEWDVATDASTWSDQPGSLQETATEAGQTPSYAAFLASINPVDRTEVERRMRAALDGGDL